MNKGTAGLRFERRLAGERNVHRDAKGIDVGGLVGGGGVEELLGRHVQVRAEAFAGVHIAGGRALHFGEAEVGDLDLALPVEHEVRGLQIAVDDAPAAALERHVVDVVHRVADLERELVELGDEEATLLVEQALHVATVNALQEEKGLPLDLAVEDRLDDIRMPPEIHPHARFRGEPLERAAILEQVLADGLERETPMGEVIEHDVNGAHAPLVLLEDLVLVIYLIARSEFHGASDGVRGVLSGREDWKGQC